MNLLSHYACAIQMSPEGKAGAILPDLLPMHRRKLRVLPLAQYWESESNPIDEEDPLNSMREMAKGVRDHLRVDSHFHKAPLFTDLSGQLLLALKNASTKKGLKRFFPAHILAEMYLDHLLIRNQPELLDDFHQVLDDVGLDRVVAFTRLAESQEVEALRSFLEWFQRERFLEDYRSLDGIITRAQRVLIHCRQREMEPVEVTAVIDVLHSSSGNVFKPLLQFIAAMVEGTVASESGLFSKSGNLKSVRPQEDRARRTHVAITELSEPVFS